MVYDPLMFWNCSWKKDKSASIPGSPAVRCICARAAIECYVPMVHGAFPKKPPLDSRNAWRTRRLVRQHVKESKQLRWTDEEEARIVRAINIILNHTD